jgi:hypothetical protein
MAIQIIQGRPKNATAAQKLAGGIDKGLETIQNHLQGKKEKDQFKKQQEAITALTGLDVSDINNPKVLEKVVEGWYKNKTKEDLQKKKLDYLNETFGNEDANNLSDEEKLQGPNELDEEGATLQKEPSRKGLDVANISPEKLAKTASVDPNIARSLQHSQDIAIREKREGIKAKQEKTENLRKETLPIRMEISNRAEQARRGIENKEELLRLIDTGNLNDPTFAQIMDSLPLGLGKRFLSEETAEYKGALVQGYGDLRNIFSGATRVKELDILENKLADIYLTDAQKKSIIKSMTKSLQADIVREEAAAELEDKPLSALQFRKQVDKLTKPRLDALFNRIIDEQNAIIKDAENMKKIPLNLNDPEHLKIIDQFLDQAPGTGKQKENNAIKAAKKAGYTW